MGRIQVLNQVGDLVPSGVISTFVGLIANIPDGWNICDGSMSTPDLREKFVRGVPTAGTNPGVTGGVATVTLTTGNMSSHIHSSNGLPHTHNYNRSETIASGGKSSITLGGGDSIVSSVPNTNGSKAANPIQSQGGSGAHNNLPTYYNVLYIQKA